MPALSCSNQEEILTKPQPKTTLIVALQVATIVASGGNVYLLAGLYAFGVIWSFAFNGLAVLVLRYTEPLHREWKVPGNFRVAGREIPLGVLLITAVLFTTAIVNLLTKEDATIAGLIFTTIFYGIFTVSERRVAKQRRAVKESARNNS